MKIYLIRATNFSSPGYITMFFLSRWRQQHEYIEKLNMQAVLSASQQEDEFVKEFLMTYEKVWNGTYNNIIEYSRCLLLIM